MTLFSSLRRPTSSDEKDHDSDSNDGNEQETMTSPSSSRIRTPLLLDPTNNESGSDSFPLRIKLNDGKSTVDISLDNVSPDITTVQRLKEQILSKHFTPPSDDSANDDTSSSSSSVNRYLRLIVRGRMMAPDTSKLEKFSIAANDVIHAVLAKEGVRGGQQARMLRRLNHHNSNNNTNSVSNPSGAAPSSGTGAIADSVNRSQQSLWRRIGIDSNGVVVSSQPNENDETDEEDSEDESDFEDAHGEIDLEMGNGISSNNNGGNSRQQQRRRRRRRERRGFDRLRATGMTRDEVTAIRLYFARSVDRYIERRRVMIRASQRLRNSLNDIVNTGGSSSSRRQRSNTGESTNSLLDTEEDSENAEGGENNGNSNEGGDSNADSESGDNSNNNSGNNENTTFEGEVILNDRLCMEDEWMSTQGPYSEFRMNLNTSNPLLLAAITGGGAGNGTTTGTDGAALDRSPAGLFFRSRNTGTGGGLNGLEDEDEEMFGGTFTANGTFVRGSNGSNGFHPYMGPLPSAGTDKDFIWGFILGFFVGFIMLFWVWMPTVPHKQKIGIISGISFQLGLNLLRKSGEVGGTGVL